MKLNLRNTIAYLYANSLIYSGKVKKSMEAFHENKFMLSIYFHDPSKELFEKTINWLKAQKVNFISTDELVQIMNGDLKPKPSSVVLTVDDGWKGNKNNIIEFAQLNNVPITIFVSLDPVVRRSPFWWSFVNKQKSKGLKMYDVKELKKMDNNHRLAYLNTYGFNTTIDHEAMTIDDIIEADGLQNIAIESHTVSHPILTKCTDQDSKYEIYKSKSLLEGILGRKIMGFAYPNGSHGMREIEYLKKHGYKYAFTTVPDYLDLKKVKCLYSLPRFEILDKISFAENICRMSGVWFRIKSR
jgi:peptidoglycan/xylan/chitin deacetylase (PgdA/CDA1 family)